MASTKQGDVIINEKISNENRFLKTAKYLKIGTKQVLGILKLLKPFMRFILSGFRCS